MSAWIVDSHALLWFLTDDPRLSPRARATMSSGESVLLASAGCLWELAIKTSLGKLRAPHDLPRVLHGHGFDELAVTGEHAWRVRSLPSGDHRDPFDRMLVAQALVERLAVISGDERLDAYGVERHW